MKINVSSSAVRASQRPVNNETQKYVDSLQTTSDLIWWSGIRITDFLKPSQPNFVAHGKQ